MTYLKTTSLWFVWRSQRIRSYICVLILLILLADVQNTDPTSVQKILKELWFLGCDIQLIGKYHHFTGIGMFLDFTDPEISGSKLL